MHNLTICLQALVVASICFVWVVRYDNIIDEFTRYALPNWMRDMVGVLKLTFSLLLLLGIERKPLAIVGGLGIGSLMICAFVVHIRVKNPWMKRIPCVFLLPVSLAVAWINFCLLDL